MTSDQSTASLPIQSPARSHQYDAERTLATPNVLLVFPKFNPNSFWSLQELCDIRGARCPAPPLGLITVAALLPQPWKSVSSTAMRRS